MTEYFDIVLSDLVCFNFLFIFNDPKQCFMYTHLIYTHKVFPKKGLQNSLLRAAFLGTRIGKVDLQIFADALSIYVGPCNRWNC